MNDNCYGKNLSSFLYQKTSSFEKNLDLVRINSNRKQIIQDGHS